MDYARIYDQFIADRLTKQPEKPSYFEKHHIVPRSRGGSNASSNIIRLTAEDHCFAHLLLAKATNSKGDWAALKFIFGNSVKNLRIPTRREIRLAAKAREEFAKKNSGANNPLYGIPMTAERKEQLRKINTGKKRSPELNARFSEIMKKVWQSKPHPSKGKRLSEKQKALLKSVNTGRKHTQEAKDKISAGNKGKVLSEQTRAKISAARTGKKMPERSQEYRDKLSKALKGRVLSEETRKKLSKSRCGKKATDEVKLKMSQARLLGKNARAKKVRCLVTGKIWDCMKSCSSELGIKQSTLRCQMRRGEGFAKTKDYDIRFV